MTKMINIGRTMDLNQIYSLEVGNQIVTGGGIQLIENRLEVKLPKDFDRNWIAKKGGSFSKRLGKLLKTKDIIVDEVKFSALLSEVKNKHTTIPSVNYFDITDKFEWNPGDFGDRGSCFFNNPPTRGYRKTLSQLNGLAFRMYDKEGGKYRGKGRCWLIPLEFDEDGNPTVLVAWNAYGPLLSPQAQILSNFLGVSTSRTTVLLGDSPVRNDGLWINNGGSAIIIGEADSIAKYDRFDEIDLASYFYKYRCARCNDGITQDNPDSIKKGKNRYCQRCLHNRFFCSVCDTLVGGKDKVHLKDSVTGNRTRTLCIRCNEERKNNGAKEKIQEGEE